MTVAVEVISSAPAWSEERRQATSKFWGRRVEGQPFDVVIVEARFGDYRTVLVFRGSATGDPILVLREGEECPISDEGLEEVRSYLRPHFAKMREERKAS